MTTGGGWQDQVGAIYGGIKVGRSGSTLPLQVTTSFMGHSEKEQGGAGSLAKETALESESRTDRSSLNKVQRDALRSFNDRLFLIYTGKTRLARNLLQVLPVHSMFLRSVL